MSKTVLVADDSLTVQRVIQLAFTGENLDVVLVGSGDEAIEHIQGRLPDLVLADTSMPGSNGYEIAEFVRDSSPNSNIPVVLMTGAFEPVDEGRATAAGCEAILVKPFEPEKLVKTVRRLLGDSSTESPSTSSASKDVLSGYAMSPEASFAAPERLKGRELLDSSPLLTNEFVDELVERIVERMADRFVRETAKEVVARVAESVVREEIERIKAKLR